MRHLKHDYVGAWSRRVTINEGSDIQLESAASAFAIHKVSPKLVAADPRMIDSMNAEVEDLLAFNPRLGCAKVEIVKLPAGAHEIRSTWAHKVKPDRIKSRVCPFGFMQIPILEFNPAEVSSPVISLMSLNCLLVLCVTRGQFTGTIDADKAFSTSHLKEEIFMRPPSGWILPPGHTLKLNTCLNGLVQAAWVWNHRINSWLLSIGFTRSVSEPCVYFRWDKGSQLVVCGLCVDDLRIQADVEDSKNRTLELYHKQFPAHEDETNSFMSFQIEHNRETGELWRSTAPHIDKMLDAFHMTDCNPCKLPAAPGSKLVKAVGLDEEAKAFPYEELVGSLKWAASTGSPQIRYAVGQVGKFTRNPDMTHVMAAKRILRYLKGINGRRILLRRGDGKIRVSVYSDADFAGEPVSSEKAKCSTTGAVIFVEGVGLLESYSALQTTIALSTAEAELKATATAARRAMIPRLLFQELGVLEDGPIRMYEDNAACSRIISSNCAPSSMRHVEIEHHYARELYDRRILVPVDCPSAEQVADINTKNLSEEPFAQHTSTMFDGMSFAGA